MEIIDEPFEENEERHFEYAGFGIRLGALVIDRIILGIGSAVLTYGGIYAFRLGSYEVIGVSAMLQLLYFSVMESSSRQGTFGKMIVGIKVSDEYGNRLSFGKALVRSLGKIISGLILGIGFLMAAWDEKSQALHDKMAGTIVYYNR